MSVDEMVMSYVCLSCDRVIKKNGKCIGFIFFVKIVFMCGHVER